MSSFLKIDIHRGLLAIERAALVAKEQLWELLNEGPRWLKSSSGAYSVKSGYDLIEEASDRESNQVGDSSDPSSMKTFWKRIWTARLPPRIRLHGWRAFHNSIPDGINLQRRCGYPPMVCGWCGWMNESILHISRDCWAAKSLGSLLDIDMEIYNIRNGDMADWLFCCSTFLSRQNFRMLLCACWILWFARNDFTHNGRLWTIEEMTVKSKMTLAHFDGGIQVSASWHLASASSAPTAISVYCDGSWKWDETTSSGAAGWGVAVLTDTMIIALNAGISPPLSSPVSIEGLALWKALSLGVRLGLESATFYSDSLEVIRIMAVGAGSTSQPSWFPPCLQILKDHPCWKLEWTHRDRNQVADYLSKKARSSNWSWDRVDAVPRCARMSFSLMV